MRHGYQSSERTPNELTPPPRGPGIGYLDRPIPTYSPKHCGHPGIEIDPVSGHLLEQTGGKHRAEGMPKVIPW